MHAIARGVIRATQGPVSREPCRLIGGARYCLPNRPRTFHQSTTFRTVPDDAKPPKDDGILESAPVEVEEATPEETKAEDESSHAANSGVVPDQAALSQRGRAVRNGRISRLNRQKQPEGLPPVKIPRWFWNQNVNPKYGKLSTYSINEEDGSILRVDREEVEYSIQSEVYAEVETSIKAALKLRPPKNSQKNPPVRPVIVLQCPKDGGLYFLDSVVGNVASKANAHLIRLDAQDIAHIVGPYVDENLAWNWSTTSLFGYNTQEQAGKLEDYNKGSNAESPEEEAAEDDESHPAIVALGGGPGKADLFPKALQSFLKIIPRPDPLKPELSTRFFRDFRPGAPSPLSFGRAESPHELGTGSPSERSMDAQSQWNDLKLTTALEALVNSADRAHAYGMKLQHSEQESSTSTLESGSDEMTKTSKDPRTPLEKEMERNRMLSKGIQDEAAAADSQSSLAKTPRSAEPPIDIIIQIADYKELSAVAGGSQLLNRLQNIVNKKWQDGRNIVLVGTTSSSDQDGPALEKSEIQILQEDIVEGTTRTIYVPPERSESQSLLFARDEKVRIRKINIRHVEDMIMKLSEGLLKPPQICLPLDLDSAVVFSSGMEDAVWTYARVHRLANTILGSISHSEAADVPFVIDGPIFTKALDLLSRSDESKFKWGAEELKKDDTPSEEVVLNAEETAKKKASDKIEAVKKTCNRYEQGLLHGVVLPSNIKTTFNDIRAAKETIEALKSLTSLSLLRPDAFSYGVLATEKISGLLLYGPPGTGKTLLAKAVAKESGATVLEVTSAELNAMFVGESEKNVRAVFSLARKLSPCVVFIDEVDSIFASREHSRNRTGSRALLNQFLRELDGMNDLSTFIMVATNRPFDLDDAILRRLPRRLLVDLPAQKDREEILKIHLKNEVLDPNVSLEKLAKDTPFYSGSDLKHVVVTAAINATLDENKLAAKHEGDQPFKYPEKRILTQAHFAKALEEISASISEDMGSLTAIKKFDEKYGDRKGRRKKGPSMGFGGTKTVEKDSEAARVRKSVPVVEDT